MIPGLSFALACALGANLSSLFNARGASRQFRLALTSGVSAESVCFERELLDHFRLGFEKR